ncbi:MAG TPA: hypothetical protein VMV49_02140 [Candidatus Deferrimicrobium sp.]|nr:hypothetical protein [Candidatus Deferrimicrobium sp.]
MDHNEEETKNFMKKLVGVISQMSATLQGLEEKINLSNRQVAQLSKQVGEIASKIGKLDLEVEDEFLKLGKDPNRPSPESALQRELSQITQELDQIPEDIIDDELKQLLEEEEKQKVKDKKKEKS